MTNNRKGRQGLRFVVALTSFVAVALGVWIVARIWLLPAAGAGWQGFASVAVLTVTVLIAGAGLSRFRSARRWKAVLDAYAEREIAREEDRVIAAKRRSARRIPAYWVRNPVT